MELPDRRGFESEYVGGGGENDGDRAAGGHGADPRVADLGRRRAAASPTRRVESLAANIMQCCKDARLVMTAVDPPRSKGTP